MSWRVAASVCAGVVLVLGACKRPADTEPAVPSQEERPRTRPSEAAPPPAKPTRAAPQESLGVLPAGVGVPAGERAPTAAVEDAEGRAVKLEELYRRGPLLLVFYRGGWCPFCNFQVRELTTAFPEFERRGVLPVAISVDRAEEAAKTGATYTVPFPVLSDPDLAAHRAFRVIHQADAAEVARLAGFGMDLEEASGRDHHVIAIPSIFVIDRDGGVRWAHAHPDYKVRPSTEQLLEVLDGLELQAP